MVNFLAALVIGACLLGAAWTIALAALNRGVGNGLLIVLLAAEVLILVQLVVAVVKVIAGSHPDSTATFLIYAVSEILILPVGVTWSQAEKSRSATLVITVACLALAVMTVRMLQMWSTVGA